MAQAINTGVLSPQVQTFLKSADKPATGASQPAALEVIVERAPDAAVVPAIHERMDTRVRERNTSVRNAYDGISMSQVAEGGLKQVSNQLQQMRKLAIQSANGAYSDADRESLNSQFSALNNGISRIASASTFSAVDALASEGSSADSQGGATGGSNSSLSLQMSGIQSLSTDISTAEAAQISVTRIDAMIASVSSAKVNIGAVQHRFESAISDLQTSTVNPSAAQEPITDSDYAVQTAVWTRSRMLEESGTAVSTQANVSAENVLQLLA